MTVVDISVEIQRYAVELAKTGGVEIRNVVGDYAQYVDDTLTGSMDIVFTEGGILHYFGDLRSLFSQAQAFLEVFRG